VHAIQDGKKRSLVSGGGDADSGEPPLKRTIFRRNQKFCARLANGSLEKKVLHFSGFIADTEKMPFMNEIALDPSKRK
jgi:hypothetical protein